MAPTTPARARKQPSPYCTGATLRYLRTSLGLTLEDVVGIAGVSLRYLSQAENGLVSPKPTWVASVIESLGEHITKQEVRT